MPSLSSSDGPSPEQSERLAAARAELARIEAALAASASPEPPGRPRTVEPAAPVPRNPPAAGPVPDRPGAVQPGSGASDDGAGGLAEPAAPAEGGSRRGGRSRRADGPREDDPARAYDSCLRLLAERARSRGELAERLARREFSPTTIAAVLARLDREGLIDDADFADQWVHFRHRDGGKAKRALAMELRQKGVADEVAATALEQISGEDEAQRAAELVRRKLARKVVDPEMDRAQRDKEIRRLVGMLARKGYSPGLAYSVVKAEWAEASGRGD